jgi:hypothetical protein
MSEPVGTEALDLGAQAHGVVANTPGLYRAVIDAWYAVEKELDVHWEARKPIQGEATYKVFAYRIALDAVKVLLAAGWASPAEVERLSALLDQRDKKITEALRIATEGAEHYYPGFWHDSCDDIVRVLGAGDD